MPFTMPENKLLEANSQLRTCLGIYVETPASPIVELAALAGMDFVRLDLCHAPIDFGMLEKCVLAAERHGIVPMVRMGLNKSDIARVLEMGVMGIIIPDVATAERARAAVAAAKFAPVGDRGLFSASRQSGYGIVGGAEYTRWTNRQVVLGIQIESREAIDKIDEILAVDGIDLVLSGRGDLSNALGVTGQKNHPSVLQAEEKIFSKAVARGLAISPQLDSFSPDISDEIRSWNEKGAYIISLGVDAALIRRAFADAVVRARG